MIVSYKSKVIVLNFVTYKSQTSFQPIVFSHLHNCIIEVKFSWNGIYYLVPIFGRFDTSTNSRTCIISDYQHVMSVSHILSHIELTVFNTTFPRLYLQNWVAINSSKKFQLMPNLVQKTHFWCYDTALRVYVFKMLHE